jgi:hypothetical protein
MIPHAVLAYSHCLARLVVLVWLAICSQSLSAEDLDTVMSHHPQPAAPVRVIQAGTLIYAGNKTSTCFSNAFLATVARDVHVDVNTSYIDVHANDPEALSHIAFIVMSGEGAFDMTPLERSMLKAWMENGGFLLASASCSSPEWISSFRHELGLMFGAGSVQNVPLSHPLFHTLFDITDLKLHHGGSATCQGITVDGRLCCLFSPEGLNDTGNVEGCCCCGGNEIDEAHNVVSDALVYALVQ